MVSVPEIRGVPGQRPNAFSRTLTKIEQKTKTQTSATARNRSRVEVHSKQIKRKLASEKKFELKQYA